MHFKVSISDNLDESTKAIVQDYWNIDESNGFIKKPGQICSDHNITIGDLKHFVKQHSSCTIFYDACDKCDREYFKEVFSQVSFTRLIGINRSACPECETLFYKEQERNRISTQKDPSVHYSDSPPSQRIKLLNDEEKEILKSIVKLNNRDAIFKLLLSGASRDYAKHVFGILDRLEKMHLIRLIRGSKNRIDEIRFDRSLESLLFTNPNVELFTTITLDLINIDKTSENGAEYFGELVLEKETVLQLNAKYHFRGWVRTDGKLHLKIESVGNAHLRESNNISEFSGDPKHIHQILRRFNANGNSEDTLDIEFGEVVRRENDSNLPNDNPFTE